MNKKYIVRPTDQERDGLAAVIKKFKVTSQRKIDVSAIWCPRNPGFISYNTEAFSDTA